MCDFDQRKVPAALSPEGAPVLIVQVVNWASVPLWTVDNLTPTGVQTINCSPLIDSLYPLILPGHQRCSSGSNKSCTYLCTTQDSLFHPINIVCYLQSPFYIAFRLFVFTVIEIFDDNLFSYHD